MAYQLADMCWCSVQDFDCNPAWPGINPGLCDFVKFRFPFSKTSLVKMPPEIQIEYKLTIMNINQGSFCQSKGRKVHTRK